MTDASGIFTNTDVADLDEARARNRDSLFLTARMKLIACGETYEVRVRNLSEGGLMAEIARPLDVDMRVEVEIRGIGRVPGRVAWYAESRAGVALDRPIDPKQARKPVAARGAVRR